MSEPWCGIKDPPAGRKRGSMKECAEKGKVMYYGLKKIDTKILQAVKDSKKTRPSKSKIIEKISTIKGKINKLKKKLDAEKDKKKKEDIKKEANALVAEHNKYADILKNITKKKTKQSRISLHRNVSRKKYKSKKSRSKKYKY